jgi:hypothetical protein
VAKTLINALRAIAGLVAGYGIYYMWMSVRPEDDIFLAIGVGVVTAILVFVLLFLMGKGGSD